MTTISKLTACAAVLLALSAATTLSTVHAQEGAQPSPLPAGEGREIVAVACNQCHGAGVVAKLREGEAGWRKYVRDMILYGAQVQPEEVDRAVQYLSKSFGPNSAPPTATAKPATITLPEGTGKELVGTRCVMCHDLERVVSLKRNKDEWGGIIANMVSRGAMANPDEVRVINTYLTEHFSVN